MAGAYKATLVKHLEHKMDVPLLDLYLSGKVATFETKLQASGIDQLVKNSVVKVANWFKRKGPYKEPTSDVEAGL